MGKQKSHQRHERFGTKQVVFNPRPWPVYIAQEGERIDFAGVMVLKLDMETDRHSKNLGDRSRRDNRFGLIASHNHKISWDGCKMFTLTNDQPTKASLD